MLELLRYLNIYHIVCVSFKMMVPCFLRLFICVFVFEKPALEVIKTECSILCSFEMWRETGPTKFKIELHCKCVCVCTKVQ